MTTLVEELARKKCTPCEGGVAAMTDAQIAPMLKGLAGWQLDGLKIVKEFKFKDHYQAQAFSNAVMWNSHREDHHPDLHVGYNTVKVEYWTHAVGGLSENDFICAAKVDALLEG
ncbi:MAG: 4a-hydroxytetrahydrobiopterin dehydratase [Hydrogenophilales bacterium 17-62-8]|nr:MAG: 4a-hydroxytetrahydrobiopterin dehydratase [Hydrogenophilales bacterium 17-62-8]